MTNSCWLLLWLFLCCSGHAWVMPSRHSTSASSGRVETTPEKKKGPSRRHHHASASGVQREEGRRCPDPAALRGATLVATVGLALTVSAAAAAAAPPFAVVAEEYSRLGYLPVSTGRNNNNGREVVYRALPVKRESTKQAVKLAEALSAKNVWMAGTYWCPHTRRQRELWGKEAWSKIQYAECDPAGYRARPGLCRGAAITGYPTWVFPGADGPSERMSGERPLAALADRIGFADFDESREQNVPPPLGSGSCKQ